MEVFKLPSIRCKGLKSISLDVSCVTNSLRWHWFVQSLANRFRMTLSVGSLEFKALSGLDLLPEETSDGWHGATAKIRKHRYIGFKCQLHFWLWWMFWMAVMEQFSERNTNCINSQFFFVKAIPNRASKAAASASEAHFSEFVRPWRTIWKWRIFEDRGCRKWRTNHNNFVFFVIITTRW